MKMKPGRKKKKGTTRHVEHIDPKITRTTLSVTVKFRKQSVRATNQSTRLLGHSEYHLAHDCDICTYLFTHWINVASGIVDPPHPTSSELIMKMKNEKLFRLRILRFQGHRCLDSISKTKQKLL